MKQSILMLILPLFLVACNKENSKYMSQLDKVQQCIEVHPDSALQILQSFTINDLHTSAGKARYALLKSMALDKNYIDVTSDSLTSIALVYYKKHGTPDEKLKAYYYNGKINAYAGNYDSAMQNYIYGEKEIKFCSDFLAIGRLYNAKMTVYKSIYNIEEAIKPAQLSAYYYLQAGDTVRYITALNSLSSLLLSTEKFEDLNKMFFEIMMYEDKMLLSQKNNFYINKINYAISVKDPLLRNIIDEYLLSFSKIKESINWLVLANAYNELKEDSLAINSLIEHKKYNGEYDNLYFYLASEVYNSVGDFETAYKYLKHHQLNSSKESLKIFQSDVKFIEEKYLLEEQKLKQKYLIIVLNLSILVIIMIVFYVSLFVRRLIKSRNDKIKEVEEQKIKLNNEYEKAIIEKNKLCSLISNNKISRDIRKVIEERLLILNNFIVSNISGVNLDKSMVELKKYMDDNENFLQSTMLSFKLTHPKFISFLQMKGLSDWEIGCCCLYCIGLNGSEISNFLGIKYFYKRSSIIRHKLDIQSVNIDTFLSKKLKELS